MRAFTPYPLPIAARRALGVLVVAFAALASAAVHAAQTARAAVAQGAAAAAKWQPDARLTQVSTLRGQADGRAPQWLLTYYSPSAKKSAIVTVRDGAKVDVEADVRNSAVDPLPAEFVDSDQVAAAAAKAGLAFDKGAKDLGYGLVVGDQATGKPQLYWAVTVMGAKGMTSVTLNGRDGAFIRRQEVKY